MAKLPYSRVVNVTMSRNQNFPSKRGFGVALILTATSKAGQLDATHLTKVYGSMEEVDVDWDAADEPYKAAEAAFSQEPRPLQIKMGFLNVTVGTATKEQTKTALDAIYEADNAWYWICIELAMRGKAPIEDGIIEWTQAKNKLALLDSNDAGTEVLATLTSVAARNKNLFDRSAVFYHPDPSEYGAVAWAAKLGTFNFDERNSRYTAKFKYLAGVAPVNLGSSKIQIITGFTPALGQAVSAGHCANTYIDIGDRYFTVEGSTLTQNVFIDEIHATDWIIARTEEETLGILLNNAAVPFTDDGMQQLISGARTVMQQAFRAGLIANDYNPNTGLYEPAVTYDIPSVFSVPESQRKARIAPTLAVRFRYRGAVHYTTIRYQMAF